MKHCRPARPRMNAGTLADEHLQILQVSACGNQIVRVHMLQDVCHLVLDIAWASLITACARVRPHPTISCNSGCRRQTRWRPLLIPNLAIVEAHGFKRVLNGSGCTSAMHCHSDMSANAVQGMFPAIAMVRRKATTRALLSSLDDHARPNAGAPQSCCGEPGRRRTCEPRSAESRQRNRLAEPSSFAYFNIWICPVRLEA